MTHNIEREDVTCFLGLTPEQRAALLNHAVTLEGEIQDRSGVYVQTDFSTHGLKLYLSYDDATDKNLTQIEAVIMEKINVG